MASSRENQQNQNDSKYRCILKWLEVSRSAYTAISRKVVGKKVHATIPKGNMGYDQYTVPDDCSCRTYFCCFPLALANTFPWPFVPILSNFFKKKRTQNHPQCLSGLSRALFPTTFLQIAVYSVPVLRCFLTLHGNIKRSSSQTLYTRLNPQTDICLIMQSIF